MKAGAATGQPVGPDFVQDFVKRWAGLVSDQDIEGILDTCTDDVVFVDAGFPEVFHGKSDLRSALESIFGAFPDLRYEPIGEPLLALDGTVAATRVRFTATMNGALDPPGFSPTGAPVDFSAVEFFEFQDSKLRRVELVFNVMEMGVQIGAAPPPGSMGERVGVLLQRLKARSVRRKTGRSK